MFKKCRCSWLRPAVRGLVPLLVAMGTVSLTFAASQVVPLNPGDSLTATCSTGFADPTVTSTQIHYDCATAVPPSAAAAAAPTPHSPSGTVNGVPLCDGQNGRPAHDPTKWHPLLAYRADGSILCTYGHEHGANPHTADAVFGTLPLAQEISYPWATVSSTGVPENDTTDHPNKHRVYKWLVKTGLVCVGGAPDGSNKSVTAVREELHADGNLGAAVRFHSYWGQYEVTDCATGQRGRLSVGGHMDYAILMAGTNHVPLSSDPPAGCSTNGDLRQEGALGGQEQSNSVWYGSTTRPPGCDYSYGFAPFVSVQVNVGTDGWGPVDPNNPTAVHFYADRDRHHGTSVGSDALTVYISNFKTDASGLVNFTGHVDRHGNVVPEVAGKPEGMDYIPLVIRNAKPGAYGGLGPQQGDAAYNGDVPGPQGQAGYYVQTPSSD